MSVAGRLRYARQAMNLTLSEVGERTGIGSSTLSEFENGKREPRLSQLKRIADTYRRPVAFFLDEGEPAPEVVLWRQKPTSPRAEEVQTALLQHAEHYHNLEVWCDEFRPLDLPLASSSPESLDYAKAERLAHDFRNKYGLGERPGQTLLHVLEEVCRVKIFHQRFEPAGSAACTCGERFGAAVLLNALNVRWRRNFDLAHELFHLLTWHVFRLGSPSAGVVAPAPEEKLATCFARNLLMPQESLRIAIDSQLDGRRKLDFDDLFEVARQFDVSVEALLWQTSFVYRIPKERIEDMLERLRGQISFWDDRERDDPPSRPLRFRALARQALRKGLIATGRYAQYLGISRREAMETVEQDAADDAEVEVIDS